MVHVGLWQRKYALVSHLLNQPSNRVLLGWFRQLFLEKIEIFKFFVFFCLGLLVKSVFEHSLADLLVSFPQNLHIFADVLLVDLRLLQFWETRYINFDLLRPTVLALFDVDSLLFVHDGFRLGSGFL